MKVREECEAQVEGVADAFRECREQRRADFANKREGMRRRQEREREKRREACLENCQPKKFEVLRKSALNLRRLGRPEEALKKEELVGKMARDYWFRDWGRDFERDAKKELENLDIVERQREKEDRIAYEKELKRVRRSMDVAVKCALRAHPSTMEEEVWKASHLAATGDALKLKDLLVRRGRRAADERDRDTSWPPLFFAARAGRADCAKILLDAGADIYARDEDLRTALHMAAAYGSLQVAALLLERGAHVEAKDKRGQTPLQLAQTRDRAAPIVHFFKDWQAFSLKLRQEQQQQRGNKDDDDGSSSELPEEETDDLALREAIMNLREVQQKEDLGDVALAYVRVAEAYRFSFGDARRAIEPLESALELTERAYGAESLEAALLANNLGEVYYSLKDDRAICSFERAARTLELLNKPIDSPLRNLALYHLQRGQSHLAAPLLERLLLKNTGDLSILVTAAYAHLQTDNFDDARRHCLRAMAIASDTHGPHSLQVLQIIELQGLLTYYEEDFNASEDHFRTVLDDLQTHHNRRNPQSDPDLRRNVLNLATAICRRSGSRTLPALATGRLSISHHDLQRLLKNHTASILAPPGAAPAKKPTKLNYDTYSLV